MIPGLPARRAALRLLDAVLRRGLPLEGALGGATRDVAAPADRALARAIASETLRWMPDLDALIDGATRLRLADDAKARMVLRLALAQTLTMQTPPHAAIATALPLVDGGPRKLVHGVFGALMRQGVALPATPNLPDAVAARWEAAWGADMVADARKALAEHAPIDLGLRDADETASWADRLGATSLRPGHIRLAAGTDVTRLPGFAEGAWWVQNVSAAAVALLFGEGGGRAVLDLCAAPGGKTMQLVAAGWRATALDSDAHRMDRVAANLSRTGLTAELIVADMMTWEPPQAFAAILLDAPCSATGTFARHPEVLYRARPADITGFAGRQAAMLTRAARWLEPGGLLVYAACSLESEEGEAQIAHGEAAGLTLEAQKRILPVPGADGFFIAALRKV